MRKVRWTLSPRERVYVALTSMAMYVVHEVVILLVIRSLA